MVFKRLPLYLTLSRQLGNTSENYLTPMDHAPPLLTSPTELGLLLSFPPLNQRIGATFDNNPTVLAILRYYCFITQNMDHLHLNLERHDIERADLFRHLMNSHAFQDDIRPLIEEYRQRIRRNEPYDRRPNPLKHRPTPEVKNRPCPTFPFSLKTSPCPPLTNLQTHRFRSPFQYMTAHPPV